MVSCELYAAVMTLIFMRISRETVADTTPAAKKGRHKLADRKLRICSRGYGLCQSHARVRQIMNVTAWVD